MVDLLVESSEQVVLALDGSGYIIQRFALYYFLSVDFFLLFILLKKKYLKNSAVFGVKQMPVCPKCVMSV